MQPEEFVTLKLGFDALQTQEYCCSLGRQNLSLSRLSKGEVSSISHPAFLEADGWNKLLKMKSIKSLCIVSHRPKGSVGKDIFQMRAVCRRRKAGAWRAAWRSWSEKQVWSGTGHLQKDPKLASGNAWIREQSGEHGHPLFLCLTFEKN